MRQLRTEPFSHTQQFGAHGPALRLPAVVSDHAHESVCVLLVGLNVLVAWQALGLGLVPFLVSVAAGLCYLFACAVMAKPTGAGGNRVGAAGWPPPPPQRPMTVTDRRQQRLELKLQQLLVPGTVQQGDEIAAVVRAFLQLVQGELHGLPLRADQAVRFLQLERHDQHDQAVVRTLGRLLLSEPALLEE